MIRKSLCVAWLFGLLASTALLVSSLNQPWLVYESRTVVEGAILTCAGSQVRLHDGSGQFDATQIIIRKSEPLDRTSRYHIAIKANRGNLVVSTIAITLGIEGDSHQIAMKPGRSHSIPLWPITLAFLIMLVFTYLPLRRSRRRAKLGLCRACGYDLRGLTTPRCPECGTEFGSDSNKR
jgi:hypothetical protein